MTDDKMRYYIAGLKDAAEIAIQTNKGKEVSEKILSKATRYELAVEKQEYYPDLCIY